LAVVAADVEMPLSVEAHLLTTLDSPERVRAILDEVDSPWVRANFDPVNLLGSLPAVYDSGAVIEQAARTIGPRLAATAHIKDVRIEPDLVLKISEEIPGRGMVDMRSFIHACRHLPEGSSLIIEHLGPAESAAAISHVLGTAEAMGIEFLAPGE